MKRFFGLLFIVILLLLPSCTPVGGNKTLGEIEGYMQERPDSAFAALRGIHPGKLSSHRYKAWHALLLSEALDKNYVDLTDDSIALRAHDYFVSHGDRLHRMKSWYYLGRIRFNAGNYAEAVICYQRALEYAEATGDYHYMGLINREIANLYSEVWDSYHALDFMQNSIDAFDLADESRYSAYSRLALARLLRNHKEYDKSVEVLDWILDNCTEDYLIASAYELKALILLSEDEIDLEKVKEYIDMTHIGSVLPLNSSRYTNLARIHQLAGDVDSSDFFLNKASSLISSVNDSIYFVYNSFKILNDRKDFLQANEQIEKYLSLQDPTLYDLLGQSVSFYQGSYYQNESRQNALIARNRTYFMGLIICVLLFVAGLLFLWNRRNKQRLVEELAQTADVMDELSEVKSHNKGLSQTVAELFEERLQILQGLSDQFDQLDEKHFRKLRAKEGEPSKDEIIASFRKNLNKLRDDAELTRSMNEILDASQNGIMSKFEKVFRGDIPESARMTEDDFALVPYFFSGMKQKTISYITGYTEASVRGRKYRVKQKIESLDDSFSSEKRLFLRHLEKL